MMDRSRSRWYKYLPWLKEQAEEDTREDTTDDALEAIYRARDEQLEAESLWSKIRPVADELKKEKQQNHFAERFNILYGGGQTK